MYELTVVYPTLLDLEATCRKGTFYLYCTINFNISWNHEENRRITKFINSDNKENLPDSAERGGRLGDPKRIELLFRLEGDVLTA